MKKSEIKDSIKIIVNAINKSKDNIKGYLEPYINIKEHLEAIQSIEEDNGIETGLEYETILNDTLRSCIENSGDIENIETEFENLISDLENWMEDVPESKADQIQENYIDMLNEIKDNFDISSVECSEDLESQLEEMIVSLNDMEI